MAPADRPPTEAHREARDGERASGGGSVPARRPERSAAAGSTARPRAGRRDRVRLQRQPTLPRALPDLLIVTVVGVAVVAIAVGLVFIGATAAGLRLLEHLQPVADAAGRARLEHPPRLRRGGHGPQPLVSVAAEVPVLPAGLRQPLQRGGTLGPIPPRVYKPDDKVGPPNWIHNLEHGAIVILYRHDSPGATTDGQQAFQTFFDAFPASPICKIPPTALSPVIARFDHMPHPYAALVWDRVLYLDTWDPDLVLRFYTPSRSGSTRTAPSSRRPRTCPAALPESASPSPSHRAGGLGRAGAVRIGRPVRRRVARGEPGAVRGPELASPTTVAANPIVDRFGAGHAGQDRLRRAELPRPRRRGRRA